MSALWRAVSIIGVVLLAAGAFGSVIAHTESYTLATGDRATGLGVTTDPDGVIGLDVTTNDLGVNTVARLVTVTNNMGQSATVTVSLDTTAGADLYVGGTNVGDTYTTTLADGGSQQVDVEVTDGGLPQVQFDVTGDTGVDQLTALDRTANVKGSVTAAFSYSCNDATLTCSFDASASTTDQGNINSYDWVLGDGGTGTGETTSHTYGSAGSYTVELTVTNNQGAVDTITKTVTIDPATNNPPDADFTYNRKGNSNNVDLDGSASSDPDGTIASYEWDVDDDGTIEYTGQTVTATVPPGTDVRLIVTDNNGATDEITKTVN